MGLLIIILVLVALVYIISKSTKQASLPRKNSVRKLNSTNATTYEIANKVRILIESAKIVSETKNYEVKISRSKLMLEMLDKLSKTNTPHFTKGENWDNLVQELSDYDSKLMVLTTSLQQDISELELKRSATKCPYCEKETFQEGTRAVKCPQCGDKGMRLKITKGINILVNQNEFEKVKEIENEILVLSPSIEGCNQIQVSPEVAQIIEGMYLKLQKQN